MLLITVSTLCKAQIDSLTIIPYDTMFTLLEPELIEITGADYTAFHKADSIRQHSPKSYCQFFSEHRLDIIQTCDEICETFIVDSTTGKKLLLPSGYDQGVLGLDISPSCTQFMVYSSYDRIEYQDYYFHRAEIFGFTITKGKGVEILHASFRFYADDWSIEEVIWASDKTIALKIYEGNRASPGLETTFKYYKTDLDSHVQSSESSD